MGPGFKGLAFAALIAAVVSSLASMINSTATIFTMDIYKFFINKNATERQLVKTGRIVAVAALLIASLVAPQLATLDQVFQYIQDFTGFVSPEVVAIFLFGFFWKRTTANAAIATALVSLVMSFVIKIRFPMMPFLDRMGLVFLISAFLIIVVSLQDKNPVGKGFDISKKTFYSHSTFNLLSVVLLLILAVLYALYW